MIPNIFVDKLLVFLSRKAFPLVNNCPQSIKVLESSIVRNEVDKYDRHACVNGCKVFKKIMKKEWNQYKDEACNFCNEHRYINFKYYKHYI